MSFKPALLVIDIQHDFLPGGALAVNKGDEIIPGVLDLLDFSKYKWASVVYSQDWHPKDHTSFASNHANAKPYEEVKFTSTKDPKISSMETVWPDHCVQHTYGANFPEELIEAYKKIPVEKTIIQKGQLQDRDYYSAFNDIWDDDHTDLGPFLKEQGITHVFVVGLAYDYCVKFSSVSSAKLGFKTYVIKPLAKAILLDKIDETDSYYRENGVTIIENLDDEALLAVKT
jgi:nicotinamidase